jgi:hypothetical protein
LPSCNREIEIIPLVDLFASHGPSSIMVKFLKPLAIGYEETE